MNKPPRNVIGRRAAAGSMLGVAVIAATTVGLAVPAQAAAGVCPAAGTLSRGWTPDGHDGLDIANAHGTPILAAEAGEVTHAGPASGYGNWIRIRHADGSVTEYGHMPQPLHVAVGDQVTAGQHIADMGSEGQSTGPHLHFEVHRDGGFGHADEPYAWLAERGVPQQSCPVP